LGITKARIRHGLANAATLTQNPDRVCLTPLHQAVLSKSAAVVEGLLAAGAPVAARDKNGNSPLALARIMGERAGDASFAAVIARLSQ
jgi:ankyrin repeat protein